MVTDRHRLTGLNHKISSLPGQAELDPSQLAYLSPSSPLPGPRPWPLIGQHPANERPRAGHVTAAPPTLARISPAL